MKIPNYKNITYGELVEVASLNAKRERNFDGSTVDIIRE